MKFSRKLSLKYIAFFTVVPVLIITAWVNVECPICEGSGSIVSMPAMENIEILDMQSEEIETARDACGVYLVYNYNVSFSLFNGGKEDAEGWLKMNLRELVHNNILDTQYVAINIPGETLYNVTYNIWFGSGLELSEKTIVEGEVVIGEMPDLVCDGKGNISLNSFLLVNGLKESFNRIVKEEVEFRPPTQIDWSDYYFDNE
jgi:hypothetical protein